MPETTANATQWFADTELVIFYSASAIDKSKIVMLGQSLCDSSQPCCVVPKTLRSHYGNAIHFIRCYGADNSGLALPDAFLSSGAYNNIENEVLRLTSLRHARYPRLYDILRRCRRAIQCGRRIQKYVDHR